MSASQVANHYNKRKNVGTEERQASPIIHLKAFNNWIKSMLIQEFTRPRDRVLEIACGKGGDLLKWDKAGIDSLFGLDIAAVSIEHAQDRYRSHRNGYKFKAEFKALDCFTPELEKVLEGKRFDICSIQFAFHYAFETEEKVRQAIKTISSSLSRNGIFFGTIPNSRFIVKNLRHAKSLEFGNSIYKIRFEQDKEYPIFGHKYWFHLEDAIDDCPEYLIHFPTLIRICKENDLELLLLKSFHDYFDEKWKSGLQLLERMRVFDRDGNFPKDQWEACGVYSVFAFRKL